MLLETGAIEASSSVAPRQPNLAPSSYTPTLSALSITRLQVIVVGDLNLAHSPSDVSPRIDFGTLYAPEESAALERLVSPEDPLALVDVWRRLHPGVTDVYTVWDERTSARAFNHGLRIDYVLCSPGLLPHVKACSVVSTEVLPPKWSDHAALLLELEGLDPPPAPRQPCALWARRRETLIDSRQRSIKDMFAGPRAKKAREEPGVQSEKPTSDAPDRAKPADSKAITSQVDAETPATAPAKAKSGIHRFLTVPSGQSKKS